MQTEVTRAAPATFERFRRVVNRPLVALVAVGIIAAFVRFAHLGYPQRRIFDEYYYSKSACIFLGYDNDTCDVNSHDERYWRRERRDTGAWVHPPLGKWTIALGELAFGVDPFGWRVASAVAGTLSVLAVAGLAQLSFGRPIWTFVAGLLLATESLHVVQSRVAMLDVFVAAWIVVGFLLLLLDRRWIERRTPSAAPEPAGGDPRVPEVPPRPTPVPEPVLRPWRVAAGVAFGAAVASKWSGVTGIGVAVLLSLMWERTRRKEAGLAHPLWRALQAEGFGVVVSLLLVPAAVYVASYAAWFAEHGWDLRGWLELQGAMASYHIGLKVTDASGEPIHPYLSQAWTWPFLVRPVLYFARYPGEGIRQVIYANGNPAIFWGAVLAVPLTAYRWWRDRDWRAGFVAVCALGLYAPWLLVSRPQFLFYATPISPFLVLACVFSLRWLSELRIAGSRSRPYLPFVVGYVVLSVGLFAWFWPVLTGGVLSDEAFRLRAWFPGWT
ncbi:MAG: phospholipid carrier-dependent glycosyltransferase [Actinomycetota bacterium]|nr:MAG: phospholipid carrier-dependent glycosyltransferase [Actinomycetota bacterium]